MITASNASSNHLLSRVTFHALVYLRCEDEVALAQAVDRMRVYLDARMAPSERNVWMMTFRFGDLPDAIDEFKRVGKVRELVRFIYVMLLTDLLADLPSFKLPQQGLDLITRQTRHAAVTWNAMTV